MIIYQPSKISTQRKRPSKAIAEEVEVLRMLQYRSILSINGMYIKYLSDPTDEDCIVAVKQTGLALQHIPKNQRSIQVCIEAVKNDSAAGEFVYIDNIEDGFKLVDAEACSMHYIKPGRNVTTFDIWMKMFERAISNEPCIIIGMNFDDMDNGLEIMCTGWTTAIKYDNSLIDYMSPDTFNKIRTDMVFKCPYAFADSRWIEELTYDEIGQLIYSVPYDAEYLINKRPKEEQIDHWNLLFNICPSMIKRIPDLLDAPKTIEYNIRLIHIVGKQAIQNLPYLKNWKVEKEIMKTFDVDTLDEIGYKPFRITNKLKLWLRRRFHK